MVALGKRAGVPVFEDLGSGSWRDYRAAAALARAGECRGESRSWGVCSVVQRRQIAWRATGGNIAGEKEIVERIRRNPLFRALRVDKLTIAALEATAALYLQGRWDSIPALRMMRLSKEAIALRAQRLVKMIAGCTGLSAAVRDGESVIGGGSTPGQTLPTAVVAVRHESHSAARLDVMLRDWKPGMVGRVEQDELSLDLRTVADHQDEEIARAFEYIATES